MNHKGTKQQTSHPRWGESPREPLFANGHQFSERIEFCNTCHPWKTGQPSKYQKYFKLEQFGPKNFNHGWTRMNTDFKRAFCVLSFKTRKSFSLAETRIINPFFIRVHPCSSVVLNELFRLTRERARSVSRSV